ncbi:MAG: septum formation inhibitor Maf [Pseudomonadales bacterium]|nr:septum formation inhibitor Maf [Pseudomonadales bacterium]MCP5185396.1 septum formation inhibitor Maf [Pseudomonadales bacterium]
MQGELVLASGSPRRAELLAQIRLPFRVMVASVDETPRADERPDAYVRRLADAKASAVAAIVGDASWVLGADTTVVVDGRVLGKPVDAADNAAMLHRLSARTHQVYTAVCVARGAHRRAVVVCSEVEFSVIEPAAVAAYVRGGEGLDKAGGYAIQGLGGVFVKRLSGSYSAVVGLPLAETEALLSLCGLDTWRVRGNEI